MPLRNFTESKEHDSVEILLNLKSIQMKFC